MKYEVWALLKDHTHMKEVFVREFSSLGDACSCAGYFSETAIDPCLISSCVYKNINGFRHKIASFGNTL